MIALGMLIIAALIVTSYNRMRREQPRVPTTTGRYPERTKEWGA